MKRDVSDRRYLQTLARGLEILRAFRSDDGPIGNRELAQRTGLPKSTVTRLTYTLAQFGFIEHIQSLDKFCLGMSALTLGNTAFATLPFMNIANQIMQSFVAEVGLAVYLVTKDESHMVVGHCWRPTSVNASASLWLNVGFPFPLHNSAAGLTFLGMSSIPEADTLIDMVAELEEVDKETVRHSVDDARTQLSTRGFFSSLGGWKPSINGVAVPYKSYSFYHPVVFVAGANADMLSADQITQEIGPKMLQCIQQLEHAGSY